MKRTTMKGLLAVGTLLGGLALTGTANAIVVPDSDQPETEVCYAQVPYTVYQFSKTTSTPTSVTEYEYKKEDQKTQHEVDKYVRERSRTSAQHYSWNGGNRPLTDPPTVVPPHLDWQANTKQEPHKDAPLGLHVQGGSESNASWFYFVPFGNWSDWVGPTRWIPTGSHLAWVDVVPAANWQEHGNSFTDTYQREWTVYPTGATRQVGTGTFTKGWFTSNPGAPWIATGETRSTPGEPIVATVFYNDGNVGPENLAVKGVRANWTTDQTLDRSWKQLPETDTFYENGDRVPCDEKPGDYTTERRVSEPCTVVGQTTTKVTVYTQDWTYELNDDSEWVPMKDGVESVATYVRDLTAEEKAGCPTPTPTPTPTPSPTPTPTPEQAQLPPAPAAVAPAAVAPAAVAPAAPAPTQLPSTGSSSWVMALIALAFLAGGTGLMRLSRRPTA